MPLNRQAKPTPMSLKDASNACNRQHQELYGKRVSPMQAGIPLSRPGHELVVTEQRTQIQSRVLALLVKQGDAVTFPNRQRPVQRFPAGINFHKTQ